MIDRKNFIYGSASIAMSMLLTACGGGTESQNEQPTEQEKPKLKDIVEPVKTSDFFEDLNAALIARWDLGSINRDTKTSDQLKELVERLQAEVDIIGRYDGKQFVDSSLGQHAQQLISVEKESIQFIEDSLDSGKINTSKFQALAISRLDELKYMVVSKGFEVEDAYKDKLKDDLKEAESDGKDHIDEFIVSSVTTEDLGSYSSGHFFKLKVALQNNTSTPLECKGFDVIELDANNNILSSYKSYNKNATSAMVDPGQSFTIELTEKWDDGIAAFKTTEYYYKDSTGETITGKFSNPQTYQLN